MNTKQIYGENCVCYENYNKWVPEKVPDRFEHFYQRYQDTPDYVNLCDACTRHHFDLSVPFETFLCG